MDPVGADPAGKQHCHRHPSQKHRENPNQHRSSGVPAAADDAAQNTEEAHHHVKGSHNPEFIHTGLYHCEFSGEQLQWEFPEKEQKGRDEN